jgi:SAM-dependent methyltransferase
MADTPSTITVTSLSPPAVEELFARTVAPNAASSYLTRYDGFDFVSRFGTTALRAMEFPRLITILEFERLIGQRGITAQSVLMINGGETGDPELAYLPHERIDAVDHEVDPTRYDLHALQLERADYDFVLFSQTLEHLYNPLAGLRNVHAVMRDEGYVWTSVPAVSHQHQLPYHFTTGFTPIGLACLMEQAGFKVLDIGQWGSAKYLSHLFDLNIMPTYYDLARASLRARGVRHVLRLMLTLSPRNFVADGKRNDFDLPSQTWVLAQKVAS